MMRKHCDKQNDKLTANKETFLKVEIRNFHFGKKRNKERGGGTKKM